MLRRAFCAAFVSAAAAAVSLFMLRSRGLLLDARPDRNEYPCTGAYVTEKSGSISWKTFADEKTEFCYIRVSSGMAFADRRGEYNLRGAETAGMLYGAVHDLDPAVSGKAQADNFLSLTGPLEGRLIPAADIRLSLAERLRFRDKNKLARTVMEFADRIREREGCGVVLICDGYVYGLFSLGESGALVWAEEGTCREPFIIAYSDKVSSPSLKDKDAFFTGLTAGRNIDLQELRERYTVREKAKNV